MQKQCSPALLEIWGIPLSRKRFIIGSVKPDRSHLFLHHPHFWKISHSYVFKKIEKLARHTTTLDKKNKKFTEHLSIMLNYTADFFTAAHNITPNKLMRHIEYEAKLDSEMRKTVDTKKAAEYLQTASLMHIRDIEKHIKHQHKKYTPSFGTPQYDIDQILSACAAVTAYVLSKAAPEIKPHQKKDDTFLDQKTVCC